VKIGLFGGTFDPIHRGHVDPVRHARRALGLERVVYLPTAVPPHKRTRHLPVAPALARYAMVELALLHEEGLCASGYELTLDRPAYTAETLDHFGREMPDADLHLVIGSDSFLDLPQWHRWRDIAAMAKLVVLSRPGSDPAAGFAAGSELAALAASGRVHVVAQAPEEVSSTALREILARGERPPAGWMADLVLDFAEKYTLYR
jgi:nicotinate-nucleotide adenylyltransferase